MGNGVGSLRLKTVRSVARTSISPVFILGFTLAPRLATLPRTPMHHSSRRLPASSCASGSMSGSKTTWVSPWRSRRSMNTAPPWSRRFWTQPRRTTVSPTFLAVSSPQECVRLISVMKGTAMRRRNLTPKPPASPRSNPGDAGVRAEPPSSAATLGAGPGQHRRLGGAQVPQLERHPLLAVPGVQRGLEGEVHRALQLAGPGGHPEADRIQLRGGREDELQVVRPSLAVLHDARVG